MTTVIDLKQVDLRRLPTEYKSNVYFEYFIGADIDNLFRPSGEGLPPPGVSDHTKHVTGKGRIRLNSYDPDLKIVSVTISDLDFTHFRIPGPLSFTARIGNSYPP